MQRYISSIIMLFIVIISLVISVQIVEFNYFKNTSVYSVVNDEYNTQEFLNILDEISTETATEVYIKRYDSENKNIYTTRNENPQYTSINFHDIGDYGTDEYAGYMEIYIDDTGSNDFIAMANENMLQVELVADQPSFLEFYWSDYKDNFKFALIFLMLLMYFHTYFVVCSSKKEMSILILNRYNYFKIFARIFIEEYKILLITTLSCTLFLMLIFQYLNLNINIIIFLPAIISIFLIFSQIISFIFTTNISVLDTLKGKENNKILIVMTSIVKCVSIVFMVVTLFTSLYYINIAKENLEEFKIVEKFKDYTTFSITSSSNTGFSERESNNFIEFYEYISLNYNPFIAEPGFLDSYDQKSPVDICKKNCKLSVNENYFEIATVYDKNGNVIPSEGEEDIVKIYYSSTHKKYEEEVKNYEKFFGHKFQYIEIQKGQELPYIDNSMNQFKTGAIVDPLIIEYPPEISDNINPLSVNIISIMTGSNFLIDLSPSEVTEIANVTGNSSNFVQINTIESTYITEKENYQFEIKRNITFFLSSALIYLLITIYLIYEIFNILRYKIFIKYLVNRSLVQSFISIFILGIIPILLAFMYIIVSLGFNNFTGLILTISMLIITEIFILVVYSKKLLDIAIKILKGDV